MTNTSDNNGVSESSPMANDATTTVVSTNPTTTVARAAVDTGSTASPGPAPQSATNTDREKPRKGPIRRFFRSLFSHLVFAGLAVAAVVGYLNHRAVLGRIGDELCSRDRLGGYMTNAQPPVVAATAANRGSSSSTGTPAQPSAASASDKASGEQLDTSSETAPAASDRLAVVKKSSSGQATSDSVAAMTEVSHAAGSPHDTASKTDIAASKSADAAYNAGDLKLGQETSPPASTPGNSQATETESAAAVVAVAPETPTVPSSSGSPQQESALMGAWQAARKAASARSPDAVDAYRKLVEQNPSVVALRGEFGNVLFGLGRTKEAADQFYEAALLHLKGPQPGVAICLAEVIATIDPERATDLKTKTTQPCPYKR